MRTPFDAPSLSALWGRVGAFVLESRLIAAGPAVVALVVFVFAWQIDLPLSLVLAVALYVAVALLVPAPKPQRPLVEGQTTSELEIVLAAGRSGLARIEQDLQHAAMSPGATLCLAAMVPVAARILADFEQRPAHLAQARFAFEALLAATLVALDRSGKFGRLDAPVARRALEVLDDRVFPTLERGLRQLLDQLLTDDLRALKVDVVVLEQLLEMEGLAAAPQTPEKEPLPC